MSPLCDRGRWLKRSEADQKHLCSKDQWAYVVKILLSKRLYSDQRGHGSLLSCSQHLDHEWCVVRLHCAKLTIMWQSCSNRRLCETSPGSATPIVRKRCSHYLGVAVGKKSPCCPKENPSVCSQTWRKNPGERQEFSLQFSIWSDVVNLCSRSHNIAVLLHCLKQKGPHWKYDWHSTWVQHTQRIC